MVSILSLVCILARSRLLALGWLSEICCNLLWYWLLDEFSWFFEAFEVLEFWDSSSLITERF